MEKKRICYIDLDSFVAQLKTEDMYLCIGKDIQIKLDTSSHELETTLPTVKIRKGISFIKVELGGKITTEFLALRPKTYVYLMDDSDKNKKGNDTKMCVIKRKLEFKNYKGCLKANRFENNINYLENKQC